MAQRHWFKIKMITKEFRLAFPDDPKLKPRPDLLLMRGRMQMELLDNYMQIFEDGSKCVVPKGYITDGASIPKIAWSIVGSPYSRPYLYAAIVHDFRYEAHGHVNSLKYLKSPSARELVKLEVANPLTRRECDLGFLEGLHKTPEPKRRVYAMYIAVRVGGKGAFNNKDKHAELLDLDLI